MDERKDFNRNREEHPDRQKNGMGKAMKRAVAFVLALGLVGSGAYLVGGTMKDAASGAKVEAAGTEENDSSLTTSAQEEEEAAPASVLDVSDMVEETMPSIVAVTKKSVEEVQSYFYGRSYNQETTSTGSGIIIAKNDDELLIATNNHVVSGATELSVCFTVDTEDEADAVVEATTRGTDSAYDLAVIAVKLSDIPDEVLDQIAVAKIGDSSAVKVGQPAVVIGNALGYGQSVTSGIISALDRTLSIDGKENTFIQTDAAINFGNSGGALLNINGEVIGISSAKAADYGVEGMGYAIPMEIAQPILEDMVSRTPRDIVDTSEKGYLGIRPVDVFDEAKELYNMPAGAFVYEVIEGEAAEAAGIRQGDIITKIDGRRITTADEVVDLMNYYKAGETVDVVVLSASNGQYEERTVSVTLGKWPEDQAADTPEEPETEEFEEQEPGYNSYGDRADEGYGNGQFSPFDFFGFGY